jgi:hypothetical protein
MFTLTNPSRPPLFNFVDYNDEDLTQARLHEKKKNLMSLKILHKMDLSRLSKANALNKLLNESKNSPQNEKVSFVDHGGFQKEEIKRLRVKIEKVIRENKNPPIDDFYATTTKKFMFKRNASIDIKLSHILAPSIKKKQKKQQGSFLKTSDTNILII